MAFRRTTRRFARPRKRAIWVNIPFGAVAFTETLGAQRLVIGEDWEAQFTGIANESAILRAVVGQITIQQTTVGTHGTTAFWGLYIQDHNATVNPSFTTTGMSEVSWLTTGAFGTTSSISSSSTSALEATRDVNVRAKRKLTSRDSIYIAAQYGSDAAAPAGVLGGILRFLIARD